MRDEEWVQMQGGLWRQGVGGESGVSRGVHNHNETYIRELLFGSILFEASERTEGFPMEDLWRESREKNEDVY